VYAKNNFLVHSAKLLMNRTKIEQINKTKEQKTKESLVNEKEFLFFVL